MARRKLRRGEELVWAQLVVGAVLTGVLVVTAGRAACTIWWAMVLGATLAVLGCVPTILFYFWLIRERKLTV